MNYEQPSVIVVGSAAELVQGQENTKLGVPIDNLGSGDQTSAAAYQADE